MVVAKVRKVGGLGLVEVACIGALLLTLGFGVGRAFVLNYHDSFVPPKDVQWLKDRYGSEKSSENTEEWLIRDFFEDARGGTFLDVGSADARVGSNTYFLESQLGWSGIAVDALDEHVASYKKLRPRTKFFSLFVSDHSEQTATMFVSSRFEQYASSAREFTSRHTPDAPTARQVPTITLNDLLTAGGITAIDFMSMDIELSEPKALAGFDLARYKPRLVCIEAHPETRQAILNYFALRGYTVVGKYLRLDHINLWFMPLPAG
jgi:FkbM family methyltransferase